MGLKEDYRLKKLKKEMHRLHCEITKCCDGEGGDGLSCDDLENCQTIIDIKQSIEDISSFDCDDLENCQEIIDIKASIPTDVSDLTDDSNLLFDGDYNSLNNLPSIPTNTSELVNDSGYLACEDLENCQEIIDIKDSIPTDVSDLTDNDGKLFDGEYDSLSNTPTFKTVDGQSIIGVGNISIGDINVQSDWNELNPSSDAFIKNKPTIPVVNDGQLELNTSGIATGGTQSFSANQAGNTTFTVHVPGTEIILSFDNNVLTVSSSTGQYASAVDLSSLVTDNTYVTSMSLSGNTLILTNNDGTTVQQDLSSILFDGDYNSLTNTPIIPTDVSDLSDTNSILLEYKGEQSSAPLSPQKGWFYKNTGNGVMYYFDGTNWIAYAEGGGANILIERSLPDLHIDISNNELVPGATYKITGVHKAHTVNGIPVPALYDDGRGLGTTIFLKAVSENKLENSGSGIFYNPKYDLNTPGYNIWTNKVFVTLSNVSGTFDFYTPDFFGNIGETVTADNGAKGRILSKGQIVYVSGDWTNATSIIGDYSGATADINSVSVPSYAINDVVFWGGYAWVNKYGNVGSSDDVLNLDDDEWGKLDYTDSNYNEVVDYIEYDINNDFITRRRNEEFNIDVNQTFDYFVLSKLTNNFEYSSISVMNYGLGFSLMAQSGIMSVKIKDSYLELVNFRGGVLMFVNFDNNSYFNRVNFDNGGFLNNVNFDNGSYFENVNFDSSIFQNVNFDNNSSFSNVNFDSFSSFNKVNFDNGSYFENVNFDNGSYFENVNFDNNSYFNRVNFDNKSSFENVNFDSFRVTYSSPTTLLDNKSIVNADFKGIGGVLLSGTLPLLDLTSATIIFNSYRKEVIHIVSATNNCKLITYDTNGDRVVNDIDD